MYTDSNSSKAIFTHECGDAIVKGFPCGNVTLAVGAVVKLKNDGSVEPVTAVTDVPLGLVASGYKTTDDTARVITPFCAIVNAEADGTLDEGDHVASSGFNATSKLGKYKKAVATNWVCGVVLKGGATTTEVVIGFLETPYLKA